MKKVRFLALLLSKYINRWLSRVRKEGISSLFRSKHSTQQRVTVGILFSALLVLLFIRFGPSHSFPASISEGFVGVYNQNNLPSIVTNLVSEPLVYLNKSGEAEPNLVSGWQVNNNATLYTFKLKNNLFWNDGSPVRSSDIKFNLPDVEVSYPDDQTIEFKLADSFSPFPTLLTTPVLKNKSSVGIGKYKVTREEFNHGMVTKVILEPAHKQDVETFPRVTVHFYPDEKTAKTAFELGEIESLINISDDEDLKNQATVSWKKIKNFNKLVSIFYNTKDPVLGDKNIRKALGCSIGVIANEERVRSSIFSSSWAYNPQVKECGPENAKSYLDKVQSGKDKQVALITTPSFASVGEQVVASWKKIGINAVLRVESGIPQNFQALLIPQSLSLDPDQYTIWHSTQAKTNISRFSSPRVDKDLEDGRKISDIEKRKEKYNDLQKVLQDESPATFLYFARTNVAYRQKAEINLNKVIDLQIH